MRKSKRIKQQKEICQLLQECEDILLDPDVIKACRRFKDFIQQVHNPNKEELDRWKAGIFNVKKELKLGQKSLALLDLQNLMRQEERIVFIKKGKRMSPLGKIGKWLHSSKEQRENALQKKMLEEESRDAEKQMYMLQDQIETLYKEYERLQLLLESKVKECAALSQNSARYNIVRQEALLIKPKLKTIENQLAGYVKMLENHAGYQAMIQAGIANFDLKSYLPNSARSETIMGMISEEAEEISASSEIFGKNIQDYQFSIDKASQGSLGIEDDEFDDLVKAQRDENAQKALEHRTETQVSYTESADNEAEMMETALAKQMKEEEAIT